MNPSPSYFHRLFQICVKEMEERTKKYTVNVLRNIQRDPKDTSENAFMLPLSDLLHFFCEITMRSLSMSPCCLHKGVHEIINVFI